MDLLQSLPLQIFAFVIVLSTVVTIHELGHFLAAKACRVKVDRFSIGFGAPILARTDRHGVEWRIGWLPLGGYVRFAGDESAASVPDHEDLAYLRQEVTKAEGEQALNRYFHFKPVWQRAFVVAAGPLANFVLSSLLFAIILMWAGQVVAPIRIDGVVPGSPAAAAGFQAGDVVVSANDERLRNFNDLERTIMLRAELPTTFVVERDGRELVINATPEKKRIQDRLGVYNEVGSLGVMSTLRREEVRIERPGPVEALGGGVAQTGEVIGVTVTYLGRMLRGEVSTDQLGGILRIGHTVGGVTKQAADQGRTAPEKTEQVLFALLQLTAFISVSIGFMNLLPIPVLDGGHLLFYAYEAVARRPLAARIQAVGYRLGLAMLAGFMLFATWNDVQNLRVFQFLGGLVT
jgi:regulator of sigma E protease